MKPPPKLSASSKPSSEDEISQETASLEDYNSQDTEERNDLAWSETGSSRIGENYQVSSLPSPDTFEIGVTEYPEPEQIWDPEKARESKADLFIQNYIAPSIKESALELLSKRDYKLNGFMRDLEEITPLDGSDWSIEMHDTFRTLMHQTKHDIIAVSKAMGKSVSNCLTVYYKIINVRETRSSRRRLDSKMILAREIDKTYRSDSLDLLQRNHKKRKKKSKDESGADSSKKMTSIDKKPSTPLKSNVATPSDPPTEKETRTPTSIGSNRRGNSNNEYAITAGESTSVVDVGTDQPKSGDETAPSDPPSEDDISQSKETKASSEDTTQPTPKVATRRTPKQSNDENPSSPSTSDGNKESEPQSATSSPNDLAGGTPGSKYNTRRTRASRMEGEIVKKPEDESKRPTSTRKGKSKVEPALQDKRQGSLHTPRALRRARRNQDYSPPSKPLPGNLSEGELSTRSRRGRNSARLSGSLPDGVLSMNEPGISTELQPTNRRYSRRIRSSSESTDPNTPTTTEDTPKAKRGKSQYLEEGLDDQVSKKEKLAASSSTINYSNTKKESDDLFEERFAMLLEYKKKHGHCYVPKIYKDNQTLSYWVFRIRALYKERAKGKKTRLTDERLERLKNAGFVFWAKNSKQQLQLEHQRRKPKDDAKWNSFMIQLQQYKEEFGNCLVPKLYPTNQPLSTWVFAQRQQKRNLENPEKNSRLTKEKIKQLDAMGFVWQAKHNKEWQHEDRLRKQAMVEDAWQGHFKSLLAFKKKMGHTRVPKAYPKNQSLSSWVFRQRAMYKKMVKGEYCSLTPARFKQLEDVSVDNVIFMALNVVSHPHLLHRLVLNSELSLLPATLFLVLVILNL